MTAPIRILLIDDHIVARRGLRAMLGDEADMCVSAEAGSALEAQKWLRQQSFDVALVDINLPDKNGLDLLKWLRERHPRLAVLMMSMYAEDLYAVRALKLGAVGYLTKHADPAMLAEAVRKAASGGKYVTPSLLQKLAGMLGHDVGTYSHDALTERELAIFRLIAGGESLVGIAANLRLSPSTVTTYRARILEKMGMKSNAELTRYAINNGMLD